MGLQIRVVARGGLIFRDAGCTRAEARGCGGNAAALFRHASAFCQSKFLYPATASSCSNLVFHAPLTSIGVYTTPTKSEGISISPLTKAQTRSRPRRPANQNISPMTFCLARGLRESLLTP